MNGNGFIHYLFKEIADMAFANKNDIFKKYTEVVSDYINKGYAIVPLSRSSHGDMSVSMIDTVHKDNIICVWYDRACERVELGSRFLTAECIRIYTRRYITDKNLKYNRTLWYDEGDLIDKYTYYEVKYDKCYTDDYDEFLKIISLRETRANNANTKEDLYKERKLNIKNLSADSIDYIMSRINCICGFKRATASCIDEVVLKRRKTGRNVGIVRFSFKGKSESIAIQ